MAEIVVGCRVWTGTKEGRVCFVSRKGEEILDVEVEWTDGLTRRVPVGKLRLQGEGDADTKETMQVREQAILPVGT